MAQAMSDNGEWLAARLDREFMKTRSRVAKTLARDHTIAVHPRRCTRWLPR
jgi:hypothetical protein